MLLQLFVYIQRRLVAGSDADRKGGGGKSYQLTEKQLPCHVFYTANSNRSEDVFEQHGNSGNNVRSPPPAIREMSTGNKQAEKEKPAGGHHVHSSDNNTFSE